MIFHFQFPDAANSGAIHSDLCKLLRALTRPGEPTQTYLNAGGLYLECCIDPSTVDAVRDTWTAIQQRWNPLALDTLPQDARVINY